MSGQNFIRTHKLLIERDVPGDTSGGREVVDHTPLLNSMGVIELAIDPTSGTVADAFTIPAGSVVRWVTLHVPTAFADGTSVEVGTDGVADGLLSVTTPGDNSITVSAESLVGTAFTTDTDCNVTVTGSYTAGSGYMKIVYQDAREILSTGVNNSRGSSSVTLGY